MTWGIVTHFNWRIQSESFPKDFGTMRANDFLEISHTDVLGPNYPPPLDVHRYITGLLGSYSRCRKVYFLKTTNETIQKVGQLCADI